jgi:hypothetical protein
MCREEILHVCTLNHNTLPRIILVAMNFVQSKGKQRGMASIDIVHTWLRIHNFINGKSNQHWEETQFVLKKST